MGRGKEYHWARGKKVFRARPGIGWGKGLGKNNWGVEEERGGTPNLGGRYILLNRASGK